MRVDEVVPGELYPDRRIVGLELDCLQHQLAPDRVVFFVVPLIVIPAFQKVLECLRRCDASLQRIHDFSLGQVHLHCDH